MNEKLQNYITYLNKTKRVSKNTLMAYQKDLNDYLNYLKSRSVSLSKVRKNTIYSYENVLEADGKSNASIARALASIRGFHRYLLETNAARTNPAFGISTPKSKPLLPGFLTISEIEHLLNQPKCINYKGYRDKAILELLYATGIRVSELVQLKYSDIDMFRKVITCNDRSIPFGAFSEDALTKYLSVSPFHKESEIDDDTYLFVNTRGTQLTRQGVWKIIKKHHQSSAIRKDISPQILRNSFAAHLIQNGADIKSVQEMMGHTALSSTLIYAEISRSHIQNVYQESHPRAKIAKSD